MERTLLQGATIIDGISDGPSVGSLLIEGATIAAVGASVGPSDGDTVVDCTGLYLLPGFVDSHCHLIYSEAKDLYDLELAKSLAEATIDGVANARHLLDLGFTTVRDLGSRGNIGVAIREAIMAGRVSGPRVLAAGTIITTIGGLLDGHPSHVFEGGPYPYGHGEMITGPWEARNAVRRQVKDGVDWIKTETSGTGFNPLCPADRDTVSDEEFGAIVDEARRKGRPVAVHAESRLGILKAARAGVATIEHGVFMDQEALELILEKEIAYSPTLALYVGLADWGHQVGIPEAIVELQKSTRGQHIQSVQSAYRAGATIIAGSDAGVPGFPQGGVLKEVEAYVNVVGMSPMEAIKTMTANPARAFGLDQTIGSLRAGLTADLVVVSTDPLAEIGTLQREDGRTAVLKDGVVVAGSLPG